MAKTIVNTFTTFELTTEESLRGSVLLTQQVRVLQNHLSEIAHTKLNLAIDTTDTVKSIQEEAYYRAQIDLINYLLANSEACSETLKSEHDIHLV